MLGLGWVWSVGQTCGLYDICTQKKTPQWAKAPQKSGCEIPLYRFNIIAKSSFLRKAAPGVRRMLSCTQERTRGGTTKTKFRALPTIFSPAQVGVYKYLLHEQYAFKISQCIRMYVVVRFVLGRGGYRANPIPAKAKSTWSYALASFRNRTIHP